MRPLTILHTEWSKGWGGQEIRTISESLGVASHGHRVILAARPECQILPRARAAGLLTYALPMRHSGDVRAIAALCRIIRRERVDIVNTHSSIDSWVGGLAATLMRRTLIRTRHLSAPWKRHPLNFVHYLPDAIITTGEALRQQLITHNRLDAATIVSVPTGVDIAYFAPQRCNAERRAALGLPPGVPVIAKVAVLRPFKRHDILLDAVTSLRAWPNLHVLLVGGGSGQAEIEAAVVARGLGTRVRLLGHVDDVRPALSCADIVVSASGSHEGVPQALTQAMAMARPVVATDVGGVSELVRDGCTGLLVAPNDPDALAAAIARFLADPHLAATCAAGGRAHVIQHFSHEAMIARILALYERLVA